jgi:P pilus assembly chaperone PapD
MNSHKITTPPSGENSQRWGLAFLLILFLAYASNVLGGVLVAPTVIFINDKSRTGRLEVQNPTNQPREISIHFSYGLPVSDSLGNVSVPLQDTNIIDPRSAVDWVKAFPRKLILAPGATQVVRLVANPPANIPEGEYWARIVVRSQEGETTIPTPSADGTITTKLNMIMQTAIMLKYRKGMMNTRIEMTNPQAIFKDSQVVVMMDLTNTGNASYVGVLNCRVIDSEKKEVASQRSDLAVYRSLRRRVDIPVRKVPGKPPYQVDISITTDGRTDIAPEDIIPGNKIQNIVAVE